MNRKSLPPSGLYRICVSLPGRLRRLTASWVSKRHASCALHPQGVRRQTLVLRAVLALLALVLSFPALADVADTLPSVKPGVVGVGTFNPSGSPRANLQGTGFAVLDGRYVVSCAHIFAKPLDSEKKEIHAVFMGRDRQMTVRPAKLIATDRARDLALLKIEGDPLPALKLGNSNTAREGWQL